MPIAESSAPMVVGMRQTSSAISTAMRRRGAASRPPSGSSASTTTQEDDRQARRAGCSARSRWASSAATAPSTSAIIRSTNVSPGLDVIRTTIRSESTRVPPVTALRSPPDSRTTGARLAGDRRLVDRRDARDDVAVAGDHLAAVTTTTVAERRSADGTSSIAVRSAHRIRCRVVADDPAGDRAWCGSRAASAACALPRPSATASARFAKSTVSHSQTAIDQVKPAGTGVARRCRRGTARRSRARW